MAESVVAAPERRGTNRRRALLAALVAVLLIGGAGITQLPGLLSSKPAGPEPTIWSAITSGIKDGTVPKDVALEAFAYLYKVNIPGVTVPKGIDAADKPTSGSGALRWVRANWARLTPDQQAVVNGVMTPGPDDTVVTIDATAGATSFATPSQRAATPAALGGNVVAAAVGPRIVAPRSAGADSPPPQIVAAIEAELYADIQHIGNKLGLPVISEGFGYWKNVTLDVSEKSGGNTLLTTDAILNNIGHYSPCNVTAFKESWQNESANGLSPTFHVLMTHEVIHCYQHVVEGDVDTALAVPPWITEGTAIWLAASDTGIVEPELPSDWIQGYFTPETALTNRSYDAFGYYALLDHLGRDLWARIVPAWKAASTNAERSNAFIAVLQGDDSDVRNVWASSYLRETAWGDPWITYGFGLPDAAKVFRHPVIAIPDPGYTGTLLSRSNTVLEVGKASGQVVTVATSGLASVHDQAGASALDFTSRIFCVTDQCICPANTPRAGQDPTDQKVGLPFDVALNAPSGGSSYSVVGATLEEICGKPPTPKPNQAPCVTGCGNSNGDPHLLTLNNYRYDFQGAGEFTLLRSKDGSLEIQARQEPYGGVSSTASVATNTAIAAKVGSHRVGLYSAGDAPLVVKIDGVATDVTAAQDLGGGAQIAPYTNGYRLDFPDGTTLWALSVGKYGINAIVRPSAALKADAVGLLGPIVPGGLGVPALPDGTRLPAATDRHARHAVVYGQFADAWRVTDSSTLFDYDAGKTTADYTQKGFPADTADVTLSDLTPDQKSAGDSACTAITDQGMHDSCVFDVGVSGDSGFATSYLAAMPLYDSGIIAPTPSPTTEAPASAAPGVVSGAVSIGPAVDFRGYAFGPGNKLYASVRLPSGQAQLLEIDLATGKVLAHADVADIGEVHVAGGSVWLPGIKPDANGHNCTVTRFDASTLAEGTTTPLPCDFFDNPEIVSDGSAVWFVDVSKFDGGTNKGAVLTRIDPATGAFGPSVDLPFINGYRLDSQGALFYVLTGTDAGYYRLATGDTAMTLLVPSTPGAVYTGGTGLWMSGQGGRTALYFSDPGGPQVTLPIQDSLVGGDSAGAYVERDTGTGSELWRYPLDGSPPTKLADAPTLDGEGLGYYGDPQGISDSSGYARLWLPKSNGSPLNTLYLQWSPLP